MVATPYNIRYTYSHKQIILMNSITLQCKSLTAILSVTVTMLRRYCVTSQRWHTKPERRFELTASAPWVTPTLYFQFMLRKCYLNSGCAHELEVLLDSVTERVLAAGCF